MSPSAALHTQLAAVMESLVHAAVAELKKLVEDEAEEKRPLPARAQARSREKLARSREKLVRSRAACPGITQDFYFEVLCKLFTWK